jgi:glycerol-3-phosphate dehydrogenase (NAD(P)+)
MIAVVGAGAMGTALAMHLSRNGNDTVVLATEHDRAVVRSWREARPHPALGVVPDRHIACREPAEWAPALARADIVAVAVASQGLRPVLAAAARDAAPTAVWALATKGWQPETLLAPSEVAAAVLHSERVVTLAGPGIAAEIVAGSPTALLCASRDAYARRLVAHALTAPTMLTVTTSDVAGAEIASAYKNVVAIAVGMAQGLSERLIGSALIRTFANAQAAMFAQGMTDMVRLAEARGGHASTVVGLAGAGDLYVTCIGGRNGRFGQLLGSGVTPDQALRAIGSTVEGVANTAAALGLAARYSLDLPTARAVDLALHQRLSGERGMQQMRRLFETTMRRDAQH